MDNVFKVNKEAEGMIFDTHAHYDDDAFDEDREEIIREITENGVKNILNCAASMDGVYKSIELAKKYDCFYAAVGIHPEHADQLDKDNLEIIRNLAKESKVLAIGEIGLDYYWEENPPREVQQKALRDQMKLAEELDLPVIIHDREAHEDTLKILKEFPRVKGVVHAYSGSVEMARQCVKLGYYLGIGGVLTFKNARKLVEVVEEIPLEHLVVETDAPYMTPVPYRGERNRSDYISYVIKKIAEIKNIEEETVNKRLISNSYDLLKIGK